MRSEILRLWAGLACSMGLALSLACCGESEQPKSPRHAVLNTPNPSPEEALSNRWRHVTSLVESMPLELRAEVRAAFRVEEGSSEETATLGVLSWASSIEVTTPPRLDEDMTAAELREATLATIDILPHMDAALTGSRSSYYLMKGAIRAGHVDRAKAWAEFGIQVLVRLGSSPTVVERRAALLELSRWLQHAEATGDNQTIAVVHGALRSIDETLMEEMLDTTGAIRFMSNVYSTQLEQNPRAFQDVHQLSLPSGVSPTDLSREITRVLEQLAIAWDRSESSEIAAIARTFRYPTCSVFVSGYDRVHRETEAARSQIVEVRQAP